MGFSEYSFQSYIKKCAKQYNKLLSSQQVQKEATRVWQSAFLKIVPLYGLYREIHSSILVLRKKQM